jgi:hypothetical protein
VRQKMIAPLLSRWNFGKIAGERLRESRTAASIRGVAAGSQPPMDCRRWRGSRHPHLVPRLVRPLPRRADGTGPVSAGEALEALDNWRIWRSARVIPTMRLSRAGPLTSSAPTPT